MWRRSPRSHSAAGSSSPAKRKRETRCSNAMARSPNGLSSGNPRPSCSACTPVCTRQPSGSRRPTDCSRRWSLTRVSRVSSGRFRTRSAADRCLTSRWGVGAPLAAEEAVELAREMQGGASPPRASPRWLKSRPRSDAQNNTRARQRVPRHLQAAERDGDRAGTGPRARFARPQPRRSRDRRQCLEPGGR